MSTTTTPSEISNKQQPPAAANVPAPTAAPTFVFPQFTFGASGSTSIFTPGVFPTFGSVAASAPTELKVYIASVMK